MLRTPLYIDQVISLSAARCGGRLTRSLSAGAHTPTHPHWRRPSVSRRSCHAHVRRLLHPKRPRFSLRAPAPEVLTNPVFCTSSEMGRFPLRGSKSSRSSAGDGDSARSASESPAAAPAAAARDLGEASNAAAGEISGADSERSTKRGGVIGAVRNVGSAVYKAPSSITNAKSRALAKVEPRLPCHLPKSYSPRAQPYGRCSI